MQAKKACDKEDDDDDADDVKNVHGILRVRDARFRHESTALNQTTSQSASMFHQATEAIGGKVVNSIQTVSGSFFYRIMAIWRGTSARLRERQLRGHRDADQTRTTMLSVAAHIGQTKVRKSKPGLSCSRSERIIGASQFAQNGRSLVALAWKNEGTERFSMTLPLVGRERNAPGHR